MRVRVRGCVCVRERERERERKRERERYDQSVKGVWPDLRSPQSRWWSPSAS